MMAVWWICLLLAVLSLLSGTDGNRLRAGQTGFACTTDTRCDSSHDVCIQRGTKHWFCKVQVGSKCSVDNGQCVTGATCQGGEGGATCQCKPRFQLNGSVCLDTLLQ
ncbi:hypothetical protein V1264_007031 [Littorina saxatilis]|uniref:EGF-like domain-containing protein n=1 Tax=Littorina saxatilis TaxID=31220 RepID=A0AAN9G3B0_9CAEN